MKIVFNRHFRNIYIALLSIFFNSHWKKGKIADKRAVIMTNQSKKITIVGNWKMNGLKGFSSALVKEIVAGYSANPSFNSSVDVVLCPPFTAISSALDELSANSRNVKIGGQDCHEQKNGAYTGNISAEMLKDSGCDYVLVGHSERRQYHNETDEIVKAKAEAAHEAGLIAIICVGESLEQREAAEHLEIVGGQVKKSIPESANGQNTIIAYEPVWAIGTGKIPSLTDIKEMHAYINDVLASEFSAANISDALYGGSVKAANAAEILSVDKVGGLLVGGASLDADSFLKIIEAAALINA